MMKWAASSSIGFVVGFPSFSGWNFVRTVKAAALAVAGGLFVPRALVADLAVEAFPTFD